ncbi:hypothetical protein CYY_007285 [Polysphondylium violaceum]|uniref:DUSP domain-containing protein n=1 Tax=Polysphondylium violaceum TaxID=133409 RepID=A0A8J4PR03_9MYCE|nr:hypothetical protein CYY_007285 [Polysphondylium violaceum]
MSSFFTFGNNGVMEIGSSSPLEFVFLPNVNSNSNNINSNSNIYDDNDSINSSICIYEEESDAEIIDLSDNEDDDFDNQHSNENYDIGIDFHDTSNGFTIVFSTLSSSPTLMENYREDKPIKPIQDQILDHRYNQEKQIYQYFLNHTELEIGDAWYLVNYKWFTEWCRYMETRNTNIKLGPISNDHLLLSDLSTLRPNIVENVDFSLVPAKVWNYLAQVYNGGPSIKRFVVRELFRKNEVDLQIPLSLLLCRSSNVKETKTIYVLKNDTIQSIKDIGCQLFNLDPKNVKVWDYYNSIKHSELKGNLILDSNLLEKQNILFEEQSPS